MKQLEYKKMKNSKKSLNLIRIIIITIMIPVLGCGFQSKKEDLNLYAVNKKGGYLVLQENSHGKKSYLKVKGANYSNHYLGTIKNENNLITFYPEKAIGMNGCKSDRYNQNYFGLSLGEDEKAFEVLKNFDVSYRVVDESNVKVEVSKYDNYYQLSNNYNNIKVLFNSKDNSFFKKDSISFDPTTTMLCIDSRIRQKKYVFKIKENNVLESINYFGTPQIYNIK